MLERRLLVGGCGRSGTTYVARCIRETFGANLVPHERLGSLGTVSWYFVPRRWETHRPPFKKTFAGKQHSRGESPETTSFQHVAHVVRHPLKVIGSAPGIFTNGDWRFIAEHVPSIRSIIAPTRKVWRVIAAARYWLEWNKLMNERSPDFRFRVEDIEAAWPKLVSCLGFEPSGFPSEVSKSTNGNATGRWAPIEVSWDLISALDLKTCLEIRDLAKEYGYDVT